MRWLVLDLWPALCRILFVGCFWGLMNGWSTVVLWEMIHSPNFSTSRGSLVPLALMLTLFPLALLVPPFFRNRWLRAMVCQVRRFRTASSKRVVLRYAPELHGKIDTAEVLNLADKTLVEMEARFGRVSLFWQWIASSVLLRKRLFVYLFSTRKAVQDIVGENYGGCALAAYHAVVLSFEYPRLDELMKHEVSHLFSNRWNARPGPLLQEGLSTWLQGTERGYTIDSIAFRLLGHEKYRLCRMLGRKFFFAKENCWGCYMLAGSFTGFLLRRFGWETYKQFYYRAQGKRRFDTKFVKHFGLTLEEAEEQWRAELRQRYNEIGPAWFASMQPWS
jgi:hypothetical protein